VEYDRKFYTTALGIIVASNTGNIVITANSASDAVNYVTRVEAEKYVTRIGAANLKAELLNTVNKHFLKEQREFEEIRHRISKLEYKVSPPSVLYKEYAPKTYALEDE